MKPLRTCNDCGVEAFNEKQLEWFAKSSDQLHGRESMCRSCKVARAKVYAERNPIKTRVSHMKSHHMRNYGITTETYYERMATSDSCQICGTGDNLCYDHCHATNDFRGVLCSRCNVAIGTLGDTYESVVKALAYLENTCYTYSMTSTEIVNEED